jgi:hypothetical protein
MMFLLKKSANEIRRSQFFPAALQISHLAYSRLSLATPIATILHNRYCQTAQSMVQ